MPSSGSYASDVFINCPFDQDYRDLFNAIVFTVFDCGFRARCSLEEDDSADIRIEKIKKIVSQCKYGIHDISRTELDANTNLPRFNMPLELGLFLGAKCYGIAKQRQKKCLILDREQYRYRIFVSDIAGQDIRAHLGNVDRVIRVTRDWLRNASSRTTIPGGAKIAARYVQFRDDLPSICQNAGILEEELTYNDYATLISEWLILNAT